ncbi:MAG: hypothetical protein WBA77_19015 [Microcoleaceae cyanobacterium]
MSQLSKLNSISSSSQLKPELQAVLKGLDVQLETELSRYRRYRRRTQPSNLNNPNPSQAQKPATVLAVDQNDHQLKPNSTASDPGSQPSTVLGSVKVEGKAPLATRTPYPENSTANTPPSGDYLESSEQLIKSIDQTRPRRRRKRQPSLVASLFTPIGICSLLLFLISFAALGYVVTSSGEQKNWGLSRWLNTEEPEESPEVIEEVEPTAPTSPNLATEEFVELDLDTLSNINPSPTPITLPTPQATTPAANNNLTPPPVIPTGPDLGNMTNELVPAPTPVVPQPQPVQTPTPQPPGGAATRSQSQPVEAEDGFYYVVTNYQNPNSLATAQQVVPEAYVREFETGTKVQMGALEDADTARILAEKLRVQGITVEFDVPE